MIIFCLGITEWQKYFTGRLNGWTTFYREWLCKYSGPLYPILYENLQKNAYTELKGLFEFLHLKVSDSSLMCAVQNQEGNFHRNNTASKSVKSTYHLSEAMLANLTTAAEHVAECLHIKYGIALNYFPKKA